MNATATEMAEVIFGGDIQIESASHSGDPASSGIYGEGQATAPGFAPSDAGLILSTGQVQSVTNSNDERLRPTACGVAAQLSLKLKPAC